MVRIGALGICLGAVALTGATLQARATSVVTVTTTGDAVNGDVSSPAALTANPGPDGISLREAILATNTTPGSTTIFITFLPALAGQTILLTASLPPISRDYVTLTGLTAPDGEPAITLDGSRVTVARFTLWVKASHVTVRRFRFTRVVSGNNAVMIKAGAVMAFPAAPSRVSNIRVEDNVFSNEGIDQSATGIDLGTDPIAVDAQVTDVSIARNRFTHYAGEDGVKLQAAGTSSLIQDVTIRESTFSETAFPVELVPFGTGNRIVGTQILRNTFTGNHQPISILGTIGRDGAPPSSGNVVENTRIAGNVFSGNENPDVALNGGVINATGNVIRDTQIVNNVMGRGRPFGGINIVGGASGGSRNRVEAVQIVNNTIVRDGGSGLAIVPNQGGTENNVSGVAVSNTIFWGQGEDFFGEVTTDEVRFSITSMPGFAGVNGNIAADPRFVDPGRGDFHLQAGSPAIDAGTSDGAPATDLDDRARFDDPATPNRGAGAIPYVDIGGYEFGAPPRPRLTVSVEELGGTGTVTSAPTGIGCPDVCSASFDRNATVTLTATPAAGSRSAWSGACSAGGPCAVTMDAAKTVVATFSRIVFPLTVAVTGKGRVASSLAGISCPDACAADFEKDESLTLTATPEPGYRVEWSGACSGSESCPVNMDAAKTVSATFSPIMHTLSVAVTGKGRVTSSPAGVVCPGACTATFAEGTAVTLTAKPAAGYVFAGWTGACRSKAACSTTLNADFHVTATFARVPLCKKGQRSTRQRPCRRR